MRVPDHARRLFPDVETARLDLQSSEPFVICRLLEQGDSADLGTLFSQVSEATVRGHFRSRGHRSIDRRSRAFWTLVLGTEAQPQQSTSEATWPL